MFDFLSVCFIPYKNSMVSHFVTVSLYAKAPAFLLSGAGKRFARKLVLSNLVSTIAHPYSLVKSRNSKGGRFPAGSSRPLIFRKTKNDTSG